MKSLKIIILTVFTAVLLMVIGCSSAQNSPVLPVDMSSSRNDIPLIALERNDGFFTTLGLMGAYDLTIDKEKSTAEITEKRNLSIGQSYLVNGAGFFTIKPCSSCLKIKSIELTPDNNIRLNFKIRHPFPKGDILKPPTAMNRLDLDIFDTALLVHPREMTPQTYALTENVDVYNGFAVNASGYTRELDSVIDDPAAIPFFLVVDDTVSGSSTYNKFEMGSEGEFSVIFDLNEPLMLFDLYLTMGYGASATRPTRLIPTYFNPEFNRKNAWKIDVSVSGSWTPIDSTTTNNVVVEVYDWQTGANVNPELTNTTDIYASSEVSNVSVEIPGMYDLLKIASEPDTPSSGYPGDPLIYTFAIANENQLLQGEYIGLVKVTDERVPPSDPMVGQTDALVDVPDGISIYYKSLPEFATYQTFPVIVESVDPAVVSSIDPDQGQVDTFLTDVVISGSNFISGATIELEYAPGDVINGENVEWISSTEMHSDFDLTDATLGLYDVKVTNPSALPGVLQDAFTVVDYQVIMWQTTQGDCANTGYKEGLNGPTGVLSAPTWTSAYSIGMGNALATFLNEDTAFYSMSVNYGTYLPVCAVNLSNGSTKWTKYFGTEAGDSLQVKGLSEDGSVVICNQRLHNFADVIYGLDAEDGHELWNMPGEMMVSAYPTLDLDGNFIIPLMSVGYRSVVPQTGQVNWTATVGNPGYCTPAVGANNVVYGYVNGTSNAQMKAIYADTGLTKWTVDVAASYVGVCHNGVTVHPNGNIIVHSQNGLYCLYDNGNYPTQVWRRTQIEYPYPWYCSTAVGPDENIYLIDYNGVLRKISPTDGSTILSTSGWGNGYGLMIAIGDDGLIYTNGGTGSAFNTYTGRFRCHNPDLTERWVYNGDHYGGGFGPPAIGMNGVVYASKRELGLYAWHD